MTIADELSALSEHILLIAFVINPELINWIELQLGFLLACLLHSNEFNLSNFIMLFPRFFLRCFT